MVTTKKSSSASVSKKPAIAKPKPVATKAKPGAAKPAATKSPATKPPTAKPAAKSALSSKPSVSKDAAAGKASGKLAPKGALAKLAAMSKPKVEERSNSSKSLSGRSLDHRWAENKALEARALEARTPPARPAARPEANPLKKKEMDMFKELLLEEKSKILRHLAEVSASSEQQLDTSTASGDAADIASLEMTQASLQKIGKREAYLLKKIDLALDKITSGTYGECESCGEPISIPRLKARPVAQLCIDCKTEQEAEERRFSTRERSPDDDGDGSEESEEG